VFAGEDTRYEGAVPPYSFVTFDTFRAAKFFHCCPRPVAAKQPSASEIRPLSFCTSALHEGEVVAPRGLRGGAELAQYVVDILPRKRLTDYDRVTGIRVAGKIVEVFYHSRAEWIQMNIADELGKIGILVAENRFVPILEELAVAAEGDGMAGQEAYGGGRLPS
jgi:hypothetical protein